MSHLQLIDIDLAFGQQRIVQKLSFSLEKGRIGCLLGPSGCGKTTVLRCIAGFERVAAGEILLDGRVVSTPSEHLAPELRRIGMVFQDYALFPHLSVADNIAFGLRKESTDARKARVAELLKLVGLSDQGYKYPHEMSGGQQQRVALARALAPRPSLLLLDEPFSNLDVELRERLSHEVRDIIKATGTTAILVTHDQHEAFAVADEIGIMHEGRIQQWDTPYNLYHEPANRFVADFIGQGVFIEGRMLDERRVQIELGVLDSHTPLSCGENRRACEPDHAVDVLLRPDDVVHDDTSPLKAEVLHKAFRGADILYTLQLASGARVLSLVPSHHNHAVGERIGIRLDADHVITFQDESAARAAA
ncbi:ABC transporter ATP-binding protein [Thauera linaloolentis]|uniref:ABC transporter n=1 Tax=Thauera linaloolentis (strain DSM 12138 / JCM 21573 / CCUG 41526 / CIP 105981 / IAM 15112 / NBRC 102519 / 47Lol) TaxID=1123367 RepID=N6Z8P5_THAL4|nr:ABC transporter ATP-binding protein [Thauera linaloolentis]ENO88524.1 ABC transporter [Thauera linaloolentis 47Lol = DSM 12138]MCM8564899.1 ABC transporter ATP-binding protein [Thauera linaloolentis]